MRIHPVLPLALFALFASRCQSAQAQTAVRPSRIAPYATLAPATRLSGHLPLWANTNADTGSAPPSTPVVLTFLLARTPALQSAFDRLLIDQQDPSSPSFHQWLTPTQIGEQYGPTLDEIASVTQWLTSKGFQVTSVSPSRTFIEATGSASSASAAFATDFHLFSIDGQTRIAPTTDPAIPTAFASVIRSVEGLSDIPFRTYHTVRTAAPRAEADTLHPLATSPQGTHYLFPGDFARIYNVTPVTSAGYDGSGIKVAIVGQSRIAATDISQLQVMAGLPAKAANTILIPNSADPGLVHGDQDESTLDVARILTTAPGAQADLVIAAAASGGVSAAIQYSINTLIDPILSISYGACEASASASSVQFYNSLFSQAAAEGITVLVSSGDSAAAGCSRAFATATGTETLGMGNYLCSSSFVTCLGGTEFADTGVESTYWSPANFSNYISALGYIPEGAWNEPTVTSSAGAVTYTVAGTGSGPSAYIPKPTWQTGPGVPSDGARDTPDISFSSANHDGYFACLAYLGTAADCSHGGGVIFSGTSATAPGMAAIAALLNQRLGAKQGNLNPLLYRLATTVPSAFHDASPASSGVANCTTATASLCNNSVAARTSITGGLAGYPLQVGYDMATGLGSLNVANFLNAAAAPITASTVTLTASTTTIPAGQTLMLTATVASGGSSQTPTGTILFSAPGAFTDMSVTLSGGKATYTATLSKAGTYNLAAAYSGDSNFQSSAANVVSITVTAAATATTVTASPAFLATGNSTVFTAAITSSSTIAPTGTVQFYSNGALLGTPVVVANATAISTPIPFATKGAYAITAIYSGDANSLTSTSNALSLLVSTPGTTVTTVTAPSSNVTPGTANMLSAKIVGNGSQTPTGTVQYIANGASLAPPVPLVNGSTSLSYSFTNPGTYNITANYSGDTVYSPSTSAPASITVAKYTAATTGLSATASTLSTAQTTAVKVTLAPSSTTAPTPGGSIQLFANGAPLGAPLAVTNSAVTSPALSFETPGIYALTATYSGDASYASATLTGPTISVTLPTIAVASTYTNITLSSGAATGNTTPLTVSTLNGYVGSVALTCAVTASPASAINSPTCALGPATVTLAGASAATTLTFSTTVPHASASNGAVAQSMLPATPGHPLAPIAAAGVCLLLLPFGRRTLRANSPLNLLLLLFLAPAASLTLTGCAASLASSGSPTTATPSTPVLVGTTPGAYTITVTATPAIGAATTTTLTLTVQ